jgi:hypothetical protein
MVDELLGDQLVGHLFTASDLVLIDVAPNDSFVCDDHWIVHHTLSSRTGPAEASRASRREGRDPESGTGAGVVSD